MWHPLLEHRTSQQFGTLPLALPPPPPPLLRPAACAWAPATRRRPQGVPSTPGRPVAILLLTPGRHRVVEGPPQPRPPPCISLPAAAPAPPLPAPAEEASRPPRLRPRPHQAPCAPASGARADGAAAWRCGARGTERAAFFDDLVILESVKTFATKLFHLVVRNCCRTLRGKGAPLLRRPRASGPTAHASCTPPGLLGVPQDAALRKVGYTAHKNVRWRLNPVRVGSRERGGLTIQG
eukprot:gene3330-biopygen15751